jgi:mannose-6-phosphate isomerase
MNNLPLLQLEPEYREYVWGGTRLRPGRLTAEAWIVHEDDLIQAGPYAGPYAGRSLANLAAEMGARLLGQPVLRRSGGRFPLLVKLLDCADWLSVQVHPNDEQALRLEGPGQVGKTEAWHVLAAEDGARLIAGLKPGVSRETLAEAIRSGTILDLAQYVPVRAGDTAFIRAGTLHALGPGLLIYEVQQTSNLTYRVYDWGRPPSSGRVLHIEKSLAVADPAAEPQVQAMDPPLPPEGGAATLIRCPYFHLELLSCASHPLELDTQAASFHALTVIEGAARVQTGTESLLLQRFETAVVPAEQGAYRVVPGPSARLLKASVD